MNRSPLRALGAFVLLTACSQAGTPSDAQDTAAPPTSKICSFSEKYNEAGGGDPVATIVTMNNDGNPCWYLRKTIRGSLLIGVAMHLTTPPSHGQVTITVLDAGTRISYKPDSGFVGTDNFSVISELYRIDRPYVVTVRP
jgi:hypothetical protein